MHVVAKRLEALGITLPRPAAPVANYVPVVKTGSLVVVSGQVPFGLDGKIANVHTGKLTSASPIEHARDAARLCAINLIAQLEAEILDLDRVSRVVRLGGFFTVDGTFEALAQAMNGASNHIADVFADRGRHARTTVGVSYLPLNALCEVEAMFELEY